MTPTVVISFRKIALSRGGGKTVAYEDNRFENQTNKRRYDKNVCKVGESCGPSDEKV